MIRGAKAAAAALILVLLSGGVASAKDGDDATPPPPAAASVSGLGKPKEVKQGFYIETQIGVFTAFGGSKSVSNAQPWLGLQLGFDLPQVYKHLSFFIGAGQGFNDGACRYFDPVNGCDELTLADNSQPGQVPENFSVVPIELGTRVGLPMDLGLRDLFFYFTGDVGYTLFSPALNQGIPPGAVHFGVGVGLEYGTRIVGLSFGIEVVTRFAFLSSVQATAVAPERSSQVMPYLTGYPRFNYVF